MRWPWQKSEPVEIPEDARWVVTTHPTGHALVIPPESGVIVEEVRHTAYPVRVPKMLTDPLNIAPAFDMRYEQIRVGADYLNLKAIRHNVNTFRLQVHEIVTDPKRVARRYWHKYLVKKRMEQIRSDSNLFYGVR